MAPLAAGSVSGTVLWRTIVGQVQNRGNRTMIESAIDVVIDPPNTDDTYPTGGIPLTNLFTTGNAGDTGLDVTSPIVQVGGTPVIRYYDSATPTTLTPACIAMFHNGGTTAAAQTLVLYHMIADDGTKKLNFTEHTTDDVSASTNVTNPIVGADKAMRCTIVLRGFLRQGVSLPGVDA